MPYGEERWSTGAGVTDFGFTAQRREGFGLLDYRARYYAPGLGWFISADTVVAEYENPQSFSRYAYTVGNPLKYQDPSGHAACVGVECDQVIHPVTSELIARNRPTLQPVIEINNRVNNSIAWPVAMAGQTTKIVQMGATPIARLTRPWHIPTIEFTPSSTIATVPGPWAKISTGASYGLPFVGGTLNAIEIRLRQNAGEITPDQARREQIANSSFTAGVALGGGTLIPAAAAATSNPVGRTIAGSVSLAYDLSIAQGTYNNAVEG